MPVRLTFPNRKAFELALNDFIEKEVPAAQWRLQRKVAFDLFAKIRPVRVPGAELFKTPLVALGVLYYQIKDRL